MKILDLLKDIPVLTSTYHNEFHNSMIESAMIPVIKHCNKDLEILSLEKQMMNEF